MPDQTGIDQGLAIFGVDGFTPPTATPHNSTSTGPRAPLHLAPVLIGAAVAYGLWRTHSRR